MPIKVADIRANLNENIVHAANTIGKSKDRRKVFEAIYKGKQKVKAVDEITQITGLSRVRVLQEGGRLNANQIVEKTKKIVKPRIKKTRCIHTISEKYYLSLIILLVRISILLNNPHVFQLPHTK